MKEYHEDGINAVIDGNGDEHFEAAVLIFITAYREAIRRGWPTETLDTFQNLEMGILFRNVNPEIAGAIQKHYRDHSHHSLTETLECIIRKWEYMRDEAEDRHYNDRD
jgi:hypothetical protein